MTSGLRWKTSPATAVDDDDSGGASSFADVFADMLNVNEDMIVAAAESQAEGDVEGLIAYQRILHRDLMEMAEFIDSMFGVYSNTNSSNNSSLIATSTKKSDESESRVVVDLTAEAGDREALVSTTEKIAGGKKKSVRKKAQCGALRTAIEAEEKVRENQRSKEQWIKSRHQVLEEEGVSAIMNKNINGMLDDKDTQQGSEGLALANQLRAHQHIAAFLHASKDCTAAGSAPPMTPMNLLLASQLAVPPSLAVPASMVQVPPIPVAPSAGIDLQIKPSAVGTPLPKIALPPAHSMFNVLFAFPGAPPLMFNPQAVGGLMPMQQWQPQLQTPLPARSVVPVRPPAKAPQFKRMCESCRKRHFSVRQCRLVLQHTDPEWQSAQPLPAIRRRRRKQPAASTTKQVA